MNVAFWMLWQFLFYVMGDESTVAFYHTWRFFPTILIVLTTNQVP